MTSNDMQYTGHGSNTGGLQRHSIGDTYPWISVVTHADGAPDTWLHHYLNGSTGEETPSFYSPAAARKYLEGLRNCRAH